jgi:hypothetical protein
VRRRARTAGGQAHQRPQPGSKAADEDEGLHCGSGAARVDWETWAVGESEGQAARLYLRAEGGDGKAEQTDSSIHSRDKNSIAEERRGKKSNSAGEAEQSRTAAREDVLT